MTHINANANTNTHAKMKMKTEARQDKKRQGGGGGGWGRKYVGVAKKRNLVLCGCVMLRRASSRSSELKQEASLRFPFPYAVRGGSFGSTGRRRVCWRKSVMTRSPLALS